MRSEAAQKADFSAIRYGQCWEDADILLDALAIEPGDVCVSIASAGDNTLALLSRSPARVVALDLSPAQLACLELRVAAYRVLSHAELLELTGSRPSDRRLALYQRCRPLLAPPVSAFWDKLPQAIESGENPYLQWILTGTHRNALPFALRPENFEPIRANLDRLEWHCAAVEQYLEGHPSMVVDRFNLSDIFEYMSEANYAALLSRLIGSGRSGSRLAYWNMLAPRSRPETLSAVLKPLEERAAALHQCDKAFFYSRFVLEEIL